MDLKDLSRAMQNFVESKGWYQETSPRPQTERNIAISLSLEAAEVLEHYQWSEKTNHPQELSSELADVALYLLQLANLAGIDLEEAILSKLSINYTRQWDVDLNAQDIIKTK